MAAGYTVPFQDVALVAATAKTVVSVTPAKLITINTVVISFDGVTATNTPVLIEVCKGDGTSVGTSTAVTPVQVRGRPVAAGSSAAKAYTAEPTVLTQMKPIRIPPTSGLMVQLPLGREEQADPTTCKVIAIRLTAAQAVNVTGFIEFEE